MAQITVYVPDELLADYRRIKSEFDAEFPAKELSTSSLLRVEIGRDIRRMLSLMHGYDAVGMTPDSVYKYAKIASFVEDSTVEGERVDAQHREQGEKE